MTMTEITEMLDQLLIAESAIRTARVVALNIAAGNDGYTGEGVQEAISRATERLDLANVMAADL